MMLESIFDLDIRSLFGFRKYVCLFNLTIMWVTIRDGNGMSFFGYLPRS